MAIQRVITSAGDKTSHYTGVGYQYFYTNDQKLGRICKMQVSKQMLEDFAKGVGRVNSLNLQHLEVLDQGNGWWMICADEPQHDGVVTHFIARFNRWALNRSKLPLTAMVDTSTKRRYTIEVRQNHVGRLHRPGDRLSSAQPVSASEGSLQELAESINARFGHTKRK